MQPEPFAFEMPDGRTLHGTSVTRAPRELATTSFETPGGLITVTAPAESANPDDSAPETPENG